MVGISGHNKSSSKEIYLKYLMNEKGDPLYKYII